MVFAILLWPPQASAQQALPDNIAYYIDNAARTKSHPNDVLVMTVSNSIASYPQYVEPIIARALALAPKERGYLVDMTITNFPNFTNRILAGANMAVPQAYAPQQPIYAPPPQAYAPPPPQAAPIQMAPQVAAMPPDSQAQGARIDLSALTRKAGRGYVTFGVAYKFLSDSDLENAGSASGNLGMKKGFIANGATGYRFNNGLRGELEASFHRNITDQLNGTGFGYTAADRIEGNVTAHAFMANGYYDLPYKFFDDRLTPYFGGGGGYARVKLNITGSPTSQIADGYAYQGMVGAEFAIAPGIAINGLYKYFATKDLDFGGTIAEHKSHNMGLGLVFDF